VNEAHPLVREVLEGDSYELRVLAAQGILPLSVEELIPLQVFLAGFEDPFIAGEARKSLAGTETRILVSYLASEAPPDVQRFFALRSAAEPELIEAILRRRDVAGELLAELAPTLTPDLQETLLLRQDAILEHPEMLAELERNPRLSPFSRRRIAEYREHLLPRSSGPAAAEAAAEGAAPAGVEEEPFTEEELAELERVRSLPAEGEVDRTTGLSEHQLRALPVPMRLRLARGASRTLRALLIKDLNTNVALATLTNAAFTLDEIEQLASSHAVVDDVLVAISKKREWTARYGVCLNLARNPRLPVGIAVRFVARLAVRDLRMLGRDRNVPEVVRSTAQRLYRIKVS